MIWMKLFLLYFQSSTLPHGCVAGFINSLSLTVVTSSSRSPLVRPTSAPNQKPAISRRSTPATPTSRTAASLDNLTRKRITLDMSNSAARKSEGRLAGRETVNSDSAASSSNESSHKVKELEYRRSSTNYSDKVSPERAIPKSWCYIYQATTEDIKI